MSAVEAGLDGLAMALAWLSAGVAFSALMARSLFVMCIQLAAAGALASAAMLALGAGDGALLLALFAAIWAPVLLLGTMLLTTRAAKPMPRARVLPSLAAGAGVFVLLFVFIPDFGPQPSSASAAGPGVAVLFAPLLLVAAAACIAALGFGERGALDRGRERRS